MPPPIFLPLESPQRPRAIAAILNLARADLTPRPATMAIISALRRALKGATCYVEVNTTDLPPGSYHLTRIWREDGVELVPDQSPWNWPGVPSRSGGVIAEVLAKKSPCVAQNVQIDPKDPIYPELGDYHSIAAAPGAIGDPNNWVMLFGRSPDAFNAEFLENMVLRLSLIGTSLRGLQALGDLRRA